MNKQKKMQNNSRNGRLFFFLTLTGMVACLSSAEVIGTIEYNGGDDAPTHSSMTNTTKWNCRALFNDECCEVDEGHNSSQ